MSLGFAWGVSEVEVNQGNDMTINNWVVVSKIFYFYPELWGNDPILTIYHFFSDGLVETTNQIRFRRIFGVSSLFAET